MRLDHLLSKEQLTPSDRAKVRGTVGVQCCSHPPLVLVGECSRVEYQRIMAVHVVVAVSSTLACGLEEDGGCFGGWSFGTLLGPEITGPGLLHALLGCVGVGFCFFWLSRAWPKPA